MTEEQREELPFTKEEEAQTFEGWNREMIDGLLETIQDCKKALEIRTEWLVKGSNAWELAGRPYLPFAPKVEFEEESPEKQAERSFATEFLFEALELGRRLEALVSCRGKTKECLRANTFGIRRCCPEASAADSWCVWEKRNAKALARNTHEPRKPPKQRNKHNLRPGFKYRKHTKRTAKETSRENAKELPLSD